jgi:glycosyltransferase involved in cell wall biosynthesis
MTHWRDIKLKIGIFAPEITPSAGGSYSFVTRLLAEISAGEFESNHQFVILTSALGPIDGFPMSKIPRVSNGTFDKFILVFLRIHSFLLGRPAPSNSARIANRLNRHIRDLGIDVIWCLAPNHIIFDVPYITTVWDLEHWNKPYFPEFQLESDSWTIHENIYRIANVRAAMIIVGTETGADQLNNIYGVPKERILVNPFPIEPSAASAYERNMNLILYPAQLWPHKNHIVLIKAISRLPDNLKSRVRLVLTGSDQGNLNHIKQKVLEYGLSQNVEFMGFVTNENLELLYSTARITIFPSYFGPDNLPPLESLSHGTLTAVAEIPGARDYLGDSVFYFLPNDSEALARIIQQALEDISWGREKGEIASELLMNRTWKNYLLRVNAFLDDFSKIRENWK